MTTAAAIDWPAWAARWDRQQEGYLPDRVACVRHRWQAGPFTHDP